MYYQFTMQNITIQNQWLLEVWNYIHELTNAEEFDVHYLYTMMSGRQITDKRADLIISKLIHTNNGKYNKWFLDIISKCNIIPFNVELLIKLIDIDIEQGYEICRFYTIHHTHIFITCLQNTEFVTKIKRDADKWKTLRSQINTMPMYLFFNRYYSSNNYVLKDSENISAVVMKYLSSNFFPDDLYIELMFLITKPDTV